MKCFQDAGYSIKSFHVIKLSEFVILMNWSLIFIAVSSNVAKHDLMQEASNKNHGP